MLAALPASLAAATRTPVKRARPLPAVGEFVRFTDPTTEAIVVRLTNPASTSLLPAPTNRFVSVRERFLVFSSDRTGKPTPFQLNLRTGMLLPLAQLDDLDPQSLCLDERGKLLYLLDGGALKEITLASRKIRVVADEVSAFSPGSPAGVLIVRNGHLQQLNAGEQQLAEGVSPWCLAQPGGKGCLFGRESSSGDKEFWYIPLSGDGALKPVLLAKGRISNPVWSPDGNSALFLREVELSAGFVGSEIREAFPESGVEQRVAPTTQFAAFAPNGDGSVYVGASRSKAQPTVILLLRFPQREMTLCEHRASHPVSVSPVFSPDSRRVYFQSDHDGKSALYSVNVELLVEPTSSSTA